MQNQKQEPHTKMWGIKTGQQSLASETCSWERVVSRPYVGYRGRSVCDEIAFSVEDRGIDLDRVSQVRARQDGKTLDKTSSAKFAAQIIAEHIQGWLPVRSADPESQHEITQLRDPLAELRQRLGEVRQRDVYLWYHCDIWPSSLAQEPESHPCPLQHHKKQ